jgi:hypothetical protein
MRLILLLVIALAGCGEVEVKCINGTVYQRLINEPFWRPTMSSCKPLEETK